MADRLTAAQVAGVVKFTHGGPPAGTTVAEWVAKADQESSYRADITNAATNDATGLWQVRLFHAALVKRYSGYNVPQDRDGFREWLRSPLNAWIAAKAVYSEQGWRAWNASGGAPRPSAAHQAAAAAPDSSRATSGGAVTQDGETGPERGVEGITITDGLGSIGGFLLDVPSQLARGVGVLVDAGRWLSDRGNWARIALVIGGGAVALGSFVSLSRPAWQPVVSAVKP